MNRSSCFFATTGTNGNRSTDVLEDYKVFGEIHLRYPRESKPLWESSTHVTYPPPHYHFPPSSNCCLARVGRSHPGSTRKERMGNYSRFFSTGRVSLCTGTGRRRGGNLICLYEYERGREITASFKVKYNIKEHYSKDKKNRPDPSRAPQIL